MDQDPSRAGIWWGREKGSLPAPAATGFARAGWPCAAAAHAPARTTSVSHRDLGEAEGLAAAHAGARTHIGLVQGSGWEWGASPPDGYGLRPCRLGRARLQRTLRLGTHVALAGVMEVGSLAVPGRPAPAYVVVRIWPDRGGPAG
ncbi:hypothetical protein GCM10009741_28370 [Kribbella lupini]|uniref:Uncharacterized protein n=1 Tax=Kribbella lupini TaxID=291602 RepID=A0ABP4LMA7_9ACTN